MATTLNLQNLIILSTLSLGYTVVLGSPHSAEDFVVVTTLHQKFPRFKMSRRTGEKRLVVRMKKKCHLHQILTLLPKQQKGDYAQMMTTQTPRQGIQGNSDVTHLTMVIQRLQTAEQPSGGCQTGEMPTGRSGNILTPASRFLHPTQLIMHKKFNSTTGMCSPSVTESERL